MDVPALFILLVTCHLHLSECGRKDWWTKKLTNDFYTAGRLTARQLKYAAESRNYKSVLSVFYFHDSSSGSVCNGICEDSYLSTSQYKSVAKTAGIPYRHLPRKVSWLSTQGVDAFQAAVKTMPKPVLVHCFAGYSATGLTLLYLLKSGVFTCEEVFNQAAAIGYEYWTNPSYVELASQLSTSPSTCRKAANSLGKTVQSRSRSWTNYWQAKRLTDCVYIAGQIQRNHICDIRRAGFKAVANMRKGPMTLVTNRPSQEEVTLLNIHSYIPGTYQNGGRQLRTNLLKARLDADKPNTYISATSKDNFESMNECEFGDNVGYNETLERLYLSEKKIPYYHVPVGGYFRYDEDALIGHYCVLKELFEDYCPVMFHCRTGTRSAYFAILYLAVSEGRPCSWALSKARSIGYEFSTYPMCQVITSFKEGKYRVPVCSTPTPAGAMTQTPTASRLQQTNCTAVKSWTSWTRCSKSCDAGTQTRTASQRGPNCPTRAPTQTKQSRVCQSRPCVLDLTDIRLARRIKRPCKAVSFRNVSQVVPHCLQSNGSNMSVVIAEQRWCLGTTSSARSLCSPIKSRTRSVKSRCGRGRVLVAVNKRCAEVREQQPEQRDD